MSLKEKIIANSPFYRDTYDEPILTIDDSKNYLVCDEL